MSETSLGLVFVTVCNLRLFEVNTNQIDNYIKNVLFGKWSPYSKIIKLNQSSKASFMRGLDHIEYDGQKVPIYPENFI